MKVFFSNGNAKAIETAINGNTPADFSGLDLTGIEIHGANLIDANFKGTTLTRARFVGCQLLDVDFSDAYVEAAVFDKCEIADCDTTNADFTAAEFYECKIKNRFYYVQMECVRVIGGVCHAAFDKCEIAGATFDRARLNIDVTGANTDGDVHINPTCTFEHYGGGIKL